VIPKKSLLKAWRMIVRGQRPVLSLEITRECPLRCPGCYAYDDAHLGGGLLLRQLQDAKGDELVARVLAVVDDLKPLHLSLVGGDPLVRYREVETLLPQLLARGIFVQLVTSAFRPIAPEWAALNNFELVVSVDGLQPEHDLRRAPATYERIQKNIRGQHVVVHCTITGQMMKRPGYLEAFIACWSANSDVKKIWMSVFTPQVGAELPEIPTPTERVAIMQQLLDLRERYPKLDMAKGLIEQLAHPPASPADCIFAQTTTTLSADLTTRVSPCQFGGNPDCSRCGCIASLALAAIGDHQLVPGFRVGTLFYASLAVGRAMARLN